MFLRSKSDENREIDHTGSIGDHKNGLWNLENIRETFKYHQYRPLVGFVFIFPQK